MDSRRQERLPPRRFLSQSLPAPKAQRAIAHIPQTLLPCRGHSCWNAAARLRRCACISYKEGGPAAQFAFPDRPRPKCRRKSICRPIGPREQRRLTDILFFLCRQRIWRQGRPGRGEGKRPAGIYCGMDGLAVFHRLSPSRGKTICNWRCCPVRRRLLRQPSGAFAAKTRPM